MKIRAGFTITLGCTAPTPFIFLLNVHPSREPDLITADRIDVTPDVDAQAYRDGFGNRCLRLVAPAGEITLHSDFLIADTGREDEVDLSAPQHEVNDLPPDVLVYLLGSRYCDTQHLTEIAWKLFGGTAPGWPRVQAICDFVHERIRFDYMRADSSRTAFNGYTDGEGVCRDFAHLAVTLCRCMNIPARYCTGYLGDIGIPAVDDPMDFSAWFEAYLGGRWYTFDARHNTPRIGRILMATGRDATDVALSTGFGASQLVRFDVITDEVID
ncbi:transglutaminase-like domain-containing protein [Microvirga antarctica]|uniref:transglutaminase-like domain-containing protein n=1 Tax=Microvirga antarctica TaxID=2819233 RepID=UPI001B307E8D|nr:transglutaminase family protein [Microvirga antarctica]